MLNLRPEAVRVLFTLDQLCTKCTRNCCFLLNLQRDRTVLLISFMEGPTGFVLQTVTRLSLPSERSTIRFPQAQFIISGCQCRIGLTLYCLNGLSPKGNRFGSHLAVDVLDVTLSLSLDTTDGRVSLSFYLLQLFCLQAAKRLTLLLKLSLLRYQPTANALITPF